MQLQIEIISVSQINTIPTKNGKSYGMIEVAYKKEGKIEGKKLLSFVSPSVFAVVQTLSQGDVCYVETEKGAPNAQGNSFWQWNSIALASDVPTQVQSSSQTETQRATGTSQKTASTYPTNEERAATQVYIVRQSSLGHAVALANATGDKKATTTTIIASAKDFEAYVLGKEAEVPTAGAIDDFPDDQPL